MDKVHVYPLGDYREHDTEGITCWCKPRVEDELVIHNSLDGREKIETGEAKVQ